MEKQFKRKNVAISLLFEEPANKPKIYDISMCISATTLTFLFYIHIRKAESEKEELRRRRHHHRHSV